MRLCKRFSTLLNRTDVVAAVVSLETSQRMASQASPLASLTQTLAEPIQVRPAVPVRTASSRTIPGNARSTLPRIHLAVPSDALPDDVQHGVRKIAREAVRDNVRVVEAGAGQQSGQGSWVWTIRCAASRSVGRSVDAR